MPKQNNTIKQIHTITTAKQFIPVIPNECTTFALRKILFIKKTNTMDEKIIEALNIFDQLYEQDPNTEIYNGKEYPKEYLYSLRMLETLSQIFKNANTVQVIAAKAHHLCRWEIPRTTFAKGKQGYLKWRQTLYKHQSEKATHVLTQLQFDKQTIEDIANAIQKKGLKQNFNTQVVEDVACIVFLKYYIDNFIKSHGNDEEKIIGIVKKTWDKMSPIAHDHALQIPYNKNTSAIIIKALNLGRN